MAKKTYEEVNGNPNWQQIPIHITQELHIHPNKVHRTVDGKLWMITLRRSNSNGFSFAAANLTAFVGFEKATMVRLTNQDDSFVAEAPFTEVVENLRGEKALPSSNEWGDYFWLKEDFTISRPSEFFSEKEKTPTKKSTGNPQIDRMMGI
jgi:hypothetical protein